jgi:hypothetical protein
MTAHPETRFICDRCGDSSNLPIANTPVHARVAGPEGWQVLTIGNDPSTPPSHLCPPCAFGLKAYMSNKTLTVYKDASSM